MLMFRTPEAERILSENNYAGLMQTLSQFGSKWEMTKEIRSRYIEAWARPGALTGGLNYYRMSPLYPPTSKNDEEKIKGILNLPHEMLEVRVPTLIIWGELDQALLTGNLEGLGEYVSHLAIRRIADGSHWVTHEQPELVNSLIRAFLNTNNGTWISPARVPTM
jgi:pimeloyl-ACP methyl ester carboxylesterase